MSADQFTDILRKETVRIILERFQGDMIRKAESFAFDDIVDDSVEEQLDNAYVNRKGVPLAMDIFKPKVDQNTELPVIVVIHGGGLVMGDRRVSRKFSRQLAKKGYLVFSIEYRLAPRANVCEQLDDVCAGMDLIGRKLVDFNVDFTRMFLVSESAGAYLATYVAAMKRSKKLQSAIGYEPTRMAFKALGLISGMFYTNRRDPIGMLLAEQFYGEKGHDGTFLQYTDPEHPEIVQNLPPTFLITSRGDFLNRYTIDYHKALKKAKNNTHLLYYGGEDLTHAFPTLDPARAESADATDKMLRWFEKQAVSTERDRTMTKKELNAAKKVAERVESGVITDQRLWKYIKEINSVSEERLNAPAMISGGREYNYRQMFRMWEKYAEVFSALGINEANHSRVAIIGCVCAELVSCSYGLNMTGASTSFVPSFDTFMLDRFEEMIKAENITDIIISAFYAQPKVISFLVANKEKLGLSSIIVYREKTDTPPDLAAVSTMVNTAYQRVKNIPGILLMQDLLAKYEATPITYGSQKSGDASVIIHTSGTTKGIHKPIPHSDKGANNAVNSFLNNPQFKGYSGKRTIMVGEVAGAYMLINQIHLPFALGCPIVFITSNGFPIANLKTLEENRISILFTTPMYFDNTIKLPAQNLDLSCLETVILGGAAVSAEAKKRYNDFLAAHGSTARCINGYGLTEVCGACIVASPDRDDNAIGYPLPHIKVKIFDEQEKKFYDISDGPRTGVLYIRSESVSSGKIDDTVYFELEDIDGEDYLCTYDLVDVNEDGSLACCGRMNRYFVNNEGVRFDAGIVENGVAAQTDIVACAIVPVYDKTLHDTLPVLYVKTVTTGLNSEKTAQQALYNLFVKDSKASETNLPSQCVIVDELPITATGKVDIHNIQKYGIANSCYYRIDPIRKNGKLIDVKLMPVPREEGFGRRGVPEELQNDMDRFMRGNGILNGNNDEKQHQGFNYQSMFAGQQPPQGFGYQPMPGFNPQGFSYPNAPEGQQPPQGFGYQQMPGFNPQGFSYPNAPEGQQTPQGFGYQPMSAPGTDGAQPFQGGMPALVGQLMSLLGFLFKASQNDYDYED